jgi:hypothetical protein
MQDPTAQALLDTLSSILRVAIGRWADENLQDMVSNTLPSVLNDQINQSLDALRQIPLSFPTIGTGMINLEAGFKLLMPAINERNRAVLGLDLNINRFEDNQMDVYDLPGLPAHLPVDQNELFRKTSALASGDLSLAISLASINAILFQVWKQGALNLDLSDQIPENFQLLVNKVILSAKFPPIVVDTPQGSPYQIAISMENLELTLEDASGQKKDIHRLSIYAGLGFAVENDQLKLTIPDGVSIKFALKEQLGERMVIDPLVLEQAVQRLIWPQLQETLGSGLSVSIPTLNQSLDSLGLMNSILFKPEFPFGIKQVDGYLLLDGIFTFIF